MDLCRFQEIIKEIYFKKDSTRGIEGTFQWFVEEVGELARALRSRDVANLKEEFADVLAWLTSLSTLCNISLEEAAQKYLNGCPKCFQTPCRCL